jgi:hypothetical protein
MVGLAFTGRGVWAMKAGRDGLEGRDEERSGSHTT